MSEMKLPIKEYQYPEGNAFLYDNGFWIVTGAESTEISTRLVSQAAAEDHSERMTPYEGDAGDETANG